MAGEKGFITWTANARVNQGALNKLFKSPDGPVGRHGNSLADRIKAEMKATAPVYHGDLRDSIDYRRGRSGNDELSWNFHVRVPYGKWVIQGGGRNNAQPNPFMEEAIRKYIG